ncbi:MAG: Agmatine deiminase [Parcubacteria group bacterium GW2011_GWC2_45_7]|nr:MAG: Agmatine deiminase [Parcubacteria group bacterium GW2011_GWC2_45_7]
MVIEDLDIGHLSTNVEKIETINFMSLPEYENTSTPKRLGYRMPAEWESHISTWLAWPHDHETWQDELLIQVEEIYLKMIQELHQAEEVHLLVDDQSINTLDQATHVVASAKAQGWRAILLVGSTHHQLRAFLTFLHQLRAQAWNGRIINQPAHIEWDARPGGRRRTTGEAFQDEIKKLEKYKDSVATVEEGLRYFNL